MSNDSDSDHFSIYKVKSQVFGYLRSFIFEKVVKGVTDQSIIFDFRFRHIRVSNLVLCLYTIAQGKMSCMTQVTICSNN